MLGLSGLGYQHGWAAYWAAGGCSLGFVFAAAFVIRQLRRDASRYHVLTLGDYLAARLGGSQSAIRIVSSLLITVFLLAYVVAQFTGAGKQIQGMQLFSYQTGVLIGAVIIGVYVLIGGYAAVCWSDLVQGLLMLAVMVVFPVVALFKAGGIGSIAESLALEGINSIWMGGKGPTWGAIGFALTYFGFALGYPGMPHSIIRYITIRDDREARTAAAITVLYGGMLLFGAATLGIVGRVLIPGLEDPEQILPRFAVQYFSPAISGVILAGMSAATMSTADSQLMMASSAIVHDIGRMVLGLGRSPGSNARGASDGSMVIQMRAVIGVLTVIAIGLALLKARVIDTLVLFAWGCLGSAFSPTILGCLYWKRFTWQGAMASFVVGPTIIIAWQVFGFSKTLHGMIPGTVISALAAVGVSLLTSAPDSERSFGSSTNADKRV